MEHELLVEGERAAGPTADSESVRLRLHPWLLLASITSLFCLQLEVAVIEQIDTMSLYMTRSEIALDSAVALLLVLGVAGAWWLWALFLGLAFRFVPSAEEYSAAFAWYVGLVLPFVYLLLSLGSAIKTLLSLQSQSKWVISLLAAGICIFCLIKVRIPQLHRFCRIRLVPIAWFHVVLAALGMGALYVKNVHYFHNYQQQDQRAALARFPDIYLISLDAMAAEDMSLYGYSLPTTPNLDRFAKQSFTFDYFFANSNFTAACTTSIETGKLPWSHRTFHQGGFLRDHAQVENVAEELKRLGYYTAMITSNQWAAPFRHRTLSSYYAVDYEVELGTIGVMYRATNLIGVNTEYTVYGALLHLVSRGMLDLDALLWPDRYPAPAEPVFARGRTLLEGKTIAQPRFLWTHILPPHDPYLPPLATKKHFLQSDKLTDAAEVESLRGNAVPPGTTPEEFRARYDEMVLYADAAVGDYLEWLQKTGRWEHSVVIVTSDHGESFEHGTFLHGGPSLYEGMIRIPLLIHLPGQQQGARIAGIGQQADLLATILDLAGGTVPSWTDGQSLKPALEGKDIPARYLYSMNLEAASIFDPIAKGTLSVRDEEFKYVIRLDLQEESLYRYKEDPSEQHNLIRTNPEVASRLRSILLNKLHEVNTAQRPRR